MEGFVGLPSASPYRFNGNPGAIPFGNLGKREGRFMTPQGLNYLEFCKAILSHVNYDVSLPPRLRKPTTKECGVQVNAKVDKIIQCSLGPKTLFSQESDFLVNSKSVKSPDCSTPGGKTQYNTTVNAMRFLRPLSIYSPMFDRRAILKSVRSNDSGCEELDFTPEIVVLGDTVNDADVCETDKVPSPNSSKLFHKEEIVGSNFQFLEQRYGFFHCRKCNIRWESAYVWCISGTNKVYYKQLCRKCQVGFNPYKVESIVCKGCLQTICCCEKKQRHINMRRPHRQDLCCRCKGSRLSCDATYSFKYIV